MFQSENPIYVFHGPMNVRVEIQPSILLLALVFVGFSFGDMYDLLWALMTFAILMGSIFLHELGHAWGSLIQGIPVRRVVLFGGGGFCERKVSASAYQQELIVAMGPIVNLVIWAIASLISQWQWGVYMASDTDPGTLWFWVMGAIDNLALFNLFLALFNLLPVQPLDGGKLFHLLMLRLFSQRLSMRITGFVGLVMALVWIPAMVLMYVSMGWVLFFIPSIMVHWQMFRLHEYRHLKRAN